MSDVCGSLSVVVRYDIAALLSRFDVRVAGETNLTGKLSSLLGESLLLAVLTHFLRTVEGHEVEVLDGQPHRDDTAWGDDHASIPSQKDLDAWLVLDSGRLVAVECKQYTSSSWKFKSVPREDDALAAHAQKEWEWVSSDFAPQACWSDMNKVALPLKPPKGMPSRDTAEVRRILAIWTPVSEDGRSCMSSVATTTVRGGESIGVEVEVFSASLYLRGLLGAGMTHLESEDEDLEKVFAALGAVVEVTGHSPAG
jgi:hypothetical protein